MCRRMYSSQKFAQNHIAHEKRVWEYDMGKLMKTERVLEGNLMQSVCHPDVSMWLWYWIRHTRHISRLYRHAKFHKKILYTGGTNSQNVKHKKAIVQMSLMILYQEGFQDIQEFRDHELGLKFGRSKDDIRAVLKEKGVRVRIRIRIRDDD